MSQPMEMQMTEAASNPTSDTVAIAIVSAILFAAVACSALLIAAPTLF